MKRPWLALAVFAAFLAAVALLSYLNADFAPPR